MWDPAVNGLHLGCIVQLTSGDFNGYKAQLCDYSADANTFSLAVLDTGDIIQVGAESVTGNVDLKKPGEGGGEDSFDVVIGPRSRRDAIGDEVNSALSDKGFCIVKVVQEQKRIRETIDLMSDFEDEGKFSRLPTDVEEAQLGRGAHGKILWLDPDQNDMQGTLLVANDGNMSTIAEIIQPQFEDATGNVVTERTPAIVCRPLHDPDDEEWESPIPTDKQLREFYQTWSRSVVRIVQFMGDVGTVTLSTKSNTPLSDMLDEYRIKACSNVMIIMREDCYDYELDMHGDADTVWMQCSLLTPAPSYDVVGTVLGDMDALASVLPGPGPPTKFLVPVCGYAIQACMDQYDPLKSWAGYTAGTDAHVEFPMARFGNWTPYYDDSDNPPGWCTWVKHLSYQEGSDLFDSKVFEISISEANALDPQNRQVLEVGLHMLMQIGLTKRKLTSNSAHASISVGCDKNEWCNMPGVPSSVATNNQLAICANRFSYVFNMKGGSFVADTACSSSLIGTHLGKVNLLHHRFDPIEFHLGMGTNLSLTINLWIGGTASHMNSPGGRCFTFNATANGYNRGDGTAGILIKHGANDDERVCYFRGSDIGNDGRSASMSAPNGPAQEKCIWGALREGGMTPPESTVWECHGTGTSLGDPIEVGAVRKVQIKMKREEPLMISSNKSNFGHLEGSAAAMAMIKCVLVVIKNVSTATQHLKELNPHLEHHNFDAIFTVEPVPYKYPQGHCQVSSFGVGGTNGHAVFWGRSETLRNDDPDALFKLKMKETPPMVVADGPDPSLWDWNGPSQKFKPGAKVTIQLFRDPTDDKKFQVAYEPQEEIPELMPEYLCISGDFNSWTTEMRMIPGDMNGIFTQEIDLPASGSAKFRFLAEGDESKSIGPNQPLCSQKICTISEPGQSEGLWEINGPPSSTYRVELLYKEKSKAIS